MTTEQPSLFPLDGLQANPDSSESGLSASSTLESALPHFERFMAERDFSAHTRAAFLNDLKLFLEYLEPQTPLSACSVKRLQGFLTYLEHGRGVPLSKRSLDRRITTLKVFFGWLAEEEVLPNDPAAALLHLGARSAPPRVLTEGQIDQVLTLTRRLRDAADKPDARPHLLVLLLLDTALKKSECMNLDLADIDVSDAQHASVLVAYDRPRQRFKGRRVAVSAEWARTLPAYLAQYKPQVKLFECTGRNLEYLLHNLATQAGLSFALSFAMLRWTSAVRSLKGGMDDNTLRQRLGLSRIAWQEAGPLLRTLAQGPL
ncbi:MAG: site-specific integrase [Chloroflexi bacterium]|nr:site-specific integrase [Chloroflexota bacterium]